MAIVLTYDIPEARPPITKTRITSVRLDVANLTAELSATRSGDDDVVVETATYTVQLPQGDVDSFVAAIMTALVGSELVPDGTVNADADA